MHGIAEGDLSDAALAGVTNQRAQSIAAALFTTVGRLRETVGLIRRATHSISTASDEVATGNQDLSTRTEDAASNLQQAASAMEQLTRTTGQTARAALQAKQIASDAASTAQRGGDIVAQVVTGMEEINGAARKIGNIIGAIDGIAFQTNILALNGRSRLRGPANRAAASRSWRARCARWRNAAHRLLRRSKR